MGVLERDEMTLELCLVKSEISPTLINGDDDHVMLNEDGGGRTSA